MQDFKTRKQAEVEPFIESIKALLRDAQEKDCPTGKDTKGPKGDLFNPAKGIAGEEVKTTTKKLARD